MISRIGSAASAASRRISASGVRLRVAGALITGAVWIAAIFLGRGAFAALVAILTVLSIDELTTLLRWRGFQASRALAMTAGGVIAVSTYLGGVRGMVAALALTMLFLLIRQASIGTRFGDTSLTLGAVAYVAVLLSHLILLYDLRGGQMGVLVAVAGTWSSDIAAYFVGSAIGKTPLAPRISPKKTWEGTIAGVAAPALLAAAAGAVPRVGLASSGVWGGALAGLSIGIAIGAFGAVGDLVESRLKRELNVKDSGNIIPGHGGLLDRLDSLLFTSVAVYYLWMWLAA